MREFTWNPAMPDAAHVALIPARTLSETARALGGGGSVAVALGQAAGGDGLVGFEAGQRHSTSRLLDGEYPKVAKIFPSSSEIEAVIKTSDLIEAVKRVALVAERNTPVRLRFSAGQVAIEAGAGEDAQASEAVEAVLQGEDIEVAFNPGRPGRSPPPLRPDVIHRAVEADHAHRSGGTRRVARCQLPLRAPARAVDFLSSKDNAMQLGLIGLGKMGGNMRERIRRAGHEVVGYDRNPAVSDVPSLEALVGSLQAPRVVWVMVPSGAPTASTVAALGELLAPGDLVIDGGNSRFTDDVVNNTLLKAKGIGYLDCGVSGGIWGLENGYGLMVGGLKKHLRMA